jgi:hypothetical protein
MRLITYTAPIRPAAQPLPKKESSTAVVAGWLIIGAGLGLALVPGLGLSMLLLGIPVCAAAFLLGVIGASKGKPIRGILLILGSCVAFVVFLILPWLSAFFAPLILGLLE